MSMTPAQKQAVMVVPRITASLSFLGSAFILYSVLKDSSFFNTLLPTTAFRGSTNAARRRSSIRSSIGGGVSPRRNEQPGRIILLGASFADLLSSLMYMIGTAAFPEPKGNGNEATCNAQAFFVQFQVGAALYSGFLAWHYCLFIKYHWRKQQLQTYERVVHGIVWMFTLSVGIGSLVAGLYQPHWIRCYYGNKGEHVDTYMWAFFFSPIWISMIFGTIAMSLIYYEVKRIEAKSLKFKFSGASTVFSQPIGGGGNNHQGGKSEALSSPFQNSGTMGTGSSHGGSINDFETAAKDNNTTTTTPPSNNNRRSSFFRSASNNSFGSASPSVSTAALTTQHIDLPKTRRVAYQGLGYSGAFILTYLFPTISRIIQTSGGTVPYGIRILAVSMVSSQGFWNCIVHYLQPKIVAYWEKKRSDKLRKEEMERRKRNSILIQKLNGNGGDFDTDDQQTLSTAAKKEEKYMEVRELKVESSLTASQALHEAENHQVLQEKQAEIDRLANLVATLESQLKEKNAQESPSLEETSKAPVEPPKVTAATATLVPAEEPPKVTAPLPPPQESEQQTSAMTDLLPPAVEPTILDEEAALKKYAEGLEEQTA